MRSYVQSPASVGESSQLPLWRRAETMDLVYVGYGLLVVALVLASYLLGALGWLPHDPQAMNVGLINAAPFTSGHLLGTDFLGRNLQARLILGIQRSEEHTSELQSPCNLVCRLLLEKKKRTVPSAICQCYGCRNHAYLLSATRMSRAS